MPAADTPATGRLTVVSTRVLDALIAHIRAGAYDWVAAEAAGIGRRTFSRWMQRGEQGEQPFAELYARVWHARGLARAEAEAWVRQRYPLAWLRLGPGREHPGQPGWTSAAPAGLDETPAQPDDLPEVLAGLAEALQQVGFDPAYDERDYDDPAADEQPTGRLDDPAAALPEHLEHLEHLAPPARPHAADEESGSWIPSPAPQHGNLGSLACPIAEGQAINGDPSEDAPRVATGRRGRHRH